MLATILTAALAAPVGLGFDWEPHIAVSPTDPTVVAAANGFALQVSHDGGATFPVNAAPIIPAGYQGFCGDGVLAFDGHGRLFWTYLACGPTGGGPAWNPVVAQVDPSTGALSNVSALPPDTAANEFNDDKPWIAADTTTGAYADSVYLIWARAYKDSRGWGVMFSRSTDHGVHWSPAADIAGAASEGMRWPSSVAVAANGDVYVAYHGDGNGGSIYVARSTQGGVDFAAGTVHQRTVALTGVDLVDNPPAPGNVIPNVLFGTWSHASIAPDPSRPGNVYVVSAGSPSPDPPGDQGDVLFARSVDSGNTWTQVNPLDDTTYAFQDFPSLAVDSGGAVIVSWYDTRGGVLGSSGELLLARYASVSQDGGRTFGPNVPISTAPFDPGSSNRIGEYFGLAAGHGMGYAIWTGNNPSRPAAWQAFATSFPVALPVVTSISPASGIAGGGTTVTISGSGFVAPASTRVLFGTVAATSVHVVSPSSITAVSPAGNSLVHVRVVDSVGTSAAVDGDLYQYTAPFIPTLSLSGGGCTPGTVDAAVTDARGAPATGQTLTFTATHGLFPANGTATISMAVDATGHAQVTAEPDTAGAVTTLVAVADATTPRGSAAGSISFLASTTCQIVQHAGQVALRNLAEQSLLPIYHCYVPCNAGDGWVNWGPPSGDPGSTGWSVSANVDRQLGQQLATQRASVRLLGTAQFKELLSKTSTLSYRAPPGLGIASATASGPAISLDALASPAQKGQLHALRISLPWSGKGRERPVIAAQGAKGWSSEGVSTATVRGGRASAFVPGPGTYALFSVTFAATGKDEQDHEPGKR
jgi:hypothetical protein